VINGHYFGFSGDRDLHRVVPDVDNAADRGDSDRTLNENDIFR
jgi:hypothetical protein